MAVVALFAGALALRARASCCARRPAAGARARAVLLLAGRGARGLGGLGRARHAVRLRLHRGRAVDRHVPVGLPVHRDRRRAAALGLLAYERGRRRTGWLAAAARAVRRPGCSPGRAPRLAGDLSAAEAGRGAGASGRRCARPRSPLAAPPRRSSTTSLLSQLGRRLEARRRGERLRPLAVVGHACSGWRRSPCPRRSPTGVPRRLRRVALRVWPLAGARRLLPAARAPSRSTRSRALTLPLAVLARVASASARTAGARRGCVAALVLLSSPAPPTASTRCARRSTGPPAALPRPRGARRAALPGRGRGRGGVLTPVYSGMLRARLHGARDVDRRRLVDARTSTPAAARRGPVRRPLSPAQAQALVRRSGARFLLSTATAARTSARSCRGLPSRAALRLRDRVGGR